MKLTNAEIAIGGPDSGLAPAGEIVTADYRGPDRRARERAGIAAWASGELHRRRADDVPEFVSEQLRLHLRSAHALGRKVQAIVLSTEAWRRLRSEVGRLHGHLATSRPPRFNGVRLIVDLEAVAPIELLACREP